MTKFTEINVHYYVDMHPFKEVHILDTEAIHEWYDKQLRRKVIREQKQL